jgi:asparagine synthetase B (glutamine-hydrolysing)
MKTVGDSSFSCVKFLKTEGQGRRLLHLKPGGIFFSQGTDSTFVLYLLAGRGKLARGIRTQADLVDQLFNSSE